MFSLNLGQIIGSNYIKKDRLAVMVDSLFSGSSATKINIFIDINSVISPIFGENFDMSSMMESTELAGHLLNMAAHYRSFFRYGYNVDTDIYLVYSINASNSSRIFCPTYNQKAVDNTMLVGKYSMLKNNLQVLETLCPYFSDINFYASTFETGVMMHHIINDIRKENVPNIVISKDIMITQLIGINPDVIVMRPHKYNGIDDSYYINKNGVIPNLLSARKTRETDSNIGDGLLSLVFALSGCPERNMRSLISVNTAIKAISALVDGGRIINAHNSDISRVYNNFEEKYRAVILRGNVDNRFKAIDYIYQYAIYLSSPESILYKKAPKLFSPNSIKEISQEYFKNTQLRIDEL